MSYSLLLRDIRQLLTMAGAAPDRPLAGAALRDWLVLEDAYVACDGERIVAIGPMRELDETQVGPATKVIDASGRVVLPGLVECHTHLVFGGNRAHEFERKLAGESYLDILASGGGILSTVRATRAATDDELLASALHHLAGFRTYGITTLEAKTGYGLNRETELRLLRAAHEAGRRQPVRLVHTLLAAHVVGPEYKAQGPAAYLDYLLAELLPDARALAEYVDIFCEEGAFPVEESRRYLQAAQALGYKIKIHSEQLHDLGGTRMAADLGATSADHCDYLSAADAAHLAELGRTVVVLLPLVPLFLRQTRYADGRALVDAGVPVAVSTDFNPGSCPSKNLWLALSIACLKMGLRPKEALAAVTINAAWALDRAAEIGSIEVGKRADLVMLGLSDYQEIPYWLGENPVERVIIGGTLVPV